MTQQTQQLGTSGVSAPLPVAAGSVVSLARISATCSAQIQFTSGSETDIRNGQAAWVVWPKQTVLDSASDVVMLPGFVRAFVFTGIMQFTVSDPDLAVVALNPAFPWRTRMPMYVNASPIDAVTPQSIFRCAIPFVIAPTGTMAANGAVTLGTALFATLGSIYLFLPTGAAAAGSAAGWYFTVMSSTTVGVVNQNVYTSGQPTIPSVLVPFLAAGPGAFTGVVTQQAAHQFTLPANSLGPNGMLRMLAQFGNNNTVGAKTQTLEFGATIAFQRAPTTTIINAIEAHVHNRGVITAQLWPYGTSTTALGVPTVAGAIDPVLGAINTGADVLIRTTLQIATATDYTYCGRLALELANGA